MGRKTILTPELQERICEALRKGNYVETAAQANGVSKQAFYEWMERGEKDREAGRETQHTRFADAVKKAQSDAESAFLDVIRLAGQRNWTATAWLLERTRPGQYGRRDETRIAGHDGGQLTIAIRRERDWRDENDAPADVKPDATG